MKRIGLCLVVAASCLAASAAESADRLYVENSYGHDVVVLSIPEHEIINRIPLGGAPDDVTASSDGSVVYVNLETSVNIPFLDEGIPTAGAVVAIDTATDRIVWRASVGGMPHHITLTPDDRYLFVPLFDGAVMEVLDTQRREVVDRIRLGRGDVGKWPLLRDLLKTWFTDHSPENPLGYGAHGTMLSPDGTRLYVGSMIADLITVIDVETREIIRRIPFADAVRPFDITADEKRLYVQLSGLHGFVVVDLDSGEQLRTVELPPLPDDVKLPGFFPRTVNHGLALTPDERYLLANASLTGYVAVYSHPELELVKTIPVGSEPNWIVFSPDGHFAYISNRASNDLSVIDLKTLEEVKRIAVGDYPQRMATVRVAD